MNVIKQKFPIFSYHEDMTYLDNAATTQKPYEVIEAISHFYRCENAPVYRSSYALAEQATQIYQDARDLIASYISARSDELVFVANATAGINFVVEAWARNNIQHGQKIVLTELEHHANLLPWQRLAKSVGAELAFIPIDENGDLIYDNLEAIITNNTAIVACTDISNTFGHVIDVRHIVARARAVGARIMIDACQSVPHKMVSVKNYDCDFLVFSGHKMCGPTGIGCLYIKKEVQQEVAPYQVGGGMVFDVDYHHARYAQPPGCYEAGTPPIAQVVGLAQACKFLMSHVRNNELVEANTQLVNMAIEACKHLPHIRLIGPLEKLTQEASLFSFVHTTLHAHDVGAYLGAQNICVRTGNFCAQPVLKKLGINAAVRASFYLYNDEQDVHRLVEALSQLKR